MEIKLKKTQLTFAETLRIVEDAVSACFEMDDEGNDIGFRPEIKDVSLQCAFYENYVDGKLSEDFDEAFATYMAIDIDGIYPNNKDFNYSQWIQICHAVSDGIEFRKQKMLNDKKSSMDEAFDSLNTLLTTLNEKAKELDTKKLEKIIKKLNPQELVKAYQKSELAEGVRDKAIQDLAKENKELRNQISARNVMADKKVK
jgi:hypothetical protein